jgi:hypothetical protein
LTHRDPANAIVALVVAVALAITFALWLTRGWVLIGVPHYDPQLKPFSDAYLVLWGPSNAGGTGEWVSGACFIPSMAAEAHTQSYEPWFAFFAGASAVHVLPVAASMIALFYLAIAATMRPASAREAASACCYLHPAVLGWWSANFDLHRQTVRRPWRLLASERAVGAAGGCLVLAFATMLKIYTGLAGALAWLVAPKRRWSTVIAAVAGSVLAVAVLGPDTILVLGRGAPEGSTRFSTGAHWLLRNRGATSAWVTIAAALIATGASAAMLARAPRPTFQAWPKRTAAFNVAFLVAVPLFFVKDSYDYRFVLWLPCLALPLAWLRGGVDVAWRRLAVATLALYFVTTSVELPCALLERWVRVELDESGRTAVLVRKAARGVAARRLADADSDSGFGMATRDRVAEVR